MLPSICYPAWNLRISEIPCQLSPEAELVTLKFCNTSSTTQYSMHKVSVGTKSTYHHENSIEYALTCWVYLPLP